MGHVLGMVLSVEHDETGATVAVETPAGATDVRIDVAPDPNGARRVQRTLRQCSFVRMSCENGRWTSRVHGFGHHRPTEVRVSVATALGLLSLGLPCVMRLP
jgi:hypothetical protein